MTQTLEVALEAWFARPLIAVFVGLGAVLAPAAPAMAETIHLKNGTMVRGKIVKEDAKTFSIDTTEGRRKIAKDEIQVLPAPNPVVAAIVGIIPGAGLFYVGDYGRGAFFLGVSAATGAAGYFAARQIRPSSPSTAAVTALVAAAVPGALGAMDAFGQAWKQGEAVRYRIDYDE